MRAMSETSMRSSVGIVEPLSHEIVGRMTTDDCWNDAACKEEMTQTFIRVTFLVSTSAIACVEACSGTDAANTDAGSDATMNDAATNDSGATDASAQDAAGDAITTEAGIDAGLDAALDASGCASLTDGGCFQCCAAEDPDASQAFATQAAICACSNPGECHSDCNATLCKGKAPDAKCIACLGAADAGDCIANIESTVCGDADTTCQATAACFITCE
jgi:hypothetical protein